MGEESEETERVQRRIQSLHKLSLSASKVTHSPSIKLEVNSLWLVYSYISMIFEACEESIHDIKYQIFEAYEGKESISVQESEENDKTEKVKRLVAQEDPSSLTRKTLPLIKSPKVNFETFSHKI